jgi:O-antigen/teichoic acid export membrane protein
MKELLWKSIRRGLFFSAILFSVYIPFAFFLSNFLNVQTGLIVLTGFFIFYVFMFPVTRGMLQGRKKFKALGLNLILESATKVLFSIILVYLGWKVYGVIIALIISWIIMFFFSFRFLKEVTSARSEKGEFDKIYSSSIPVIVAMTSIVLMYSLDIIFARGFFPPQKAGEFAFVALIGKTILFVSSAVGKAMFPLSSEEFEKGQRSGGLLKKSLFLVGLIASAAVTVFFLFPKQIIWLVSLGSTQYLEAYPLLFKLGASYALLSISNILLLYRLSIHKLNRAAYFLLVFAVLEIILLLTMRSNLEEFTQGIFISNIAMFLYSVWISFTK